MSIEYKAKFQVSGKVLEIGPLKTFSSGFTKREVVIETSQNAEKFSSPVQVTFKKDDCEWVATLCVGDGVQIEGFVEGRAWDKDGTVRYFIDLAAKSVMVTEKAAKPTTAKTWKELVALGAAYGESEDRVKERAKALGKPFKEMQTADWQALAAKIIDANGGVEGSGEAPADDDDVPF